MNSKSAPSYAWLRRRLRFATFILAAGAPALPGPLRAAEGLYGGGVGARAMGMGGADVATPDSALGSLGANAAGLSLLTGPELDAGFDAASAYGSYSPRTGPGGHLSTAFDWAPEGAIAAKLPYVPLTIGIGLVPQIGLDGHWRYPDLPGGLGGAASYGNQRDNSEIQEIRVAFGMSVEITRQLSFGASLGLNYNQNLLQTPFVFQSQPVLRGFKTLLDMSTDGWGVNGSAGLLYRPTDTVSIGLSYQCPTTIKTHGSATGNASAQLNALGPAFAGVRRDFSYDAEVDNTFPQIISGGIAWKFHPGWEASAQVDWTDWADAFDTLPVRLTRGNNAQVNALVGGNSMTDNIPLGWKDRFTYRLGLEDAITQNFFLRCGYSYSKSPVPNETLSPLTAAIPENTLSLGAGYRWKWMELDLAYQWDIPVTRHVGNSELLDGEYSDSNVRVGIQWIGLTAVMRF